METPEINLKEPEWCLRELWFNSCWSRHVILTRGFKYSVYSTFKKRRKTGGSEEKLDLGFTFGLGIGALWQKNDCLQISVPAWSLTLLDLKLQAITFLFFHGFFCLFPSVALETRSWDWCSGSDSVGVQVTHLYWRFQFVTGSDCVCGRCEAIPYWIFCYSAISFKIPTDRCSVEIKKSDGPCTVREVFIPCILMIFTGFL